MNGIPASIRISLRNTLQRCDEFRSQNTLLAIFGSAELRPWRGGISDAESLDERIRLTIDFLWHKRSTNGQSALGMLLRVLAENYDPQDEVYTLLQEQAEVLEKYYISEDRKNSYSRRKGILVSSGLDTQEADVTHEEVMTGDQLSVANTPPSNLDELAERNQECARLIWRDELVYRIRDHFSQLQPHAHEFILLSGPPMIGKTRLLMRIIALLNNDFVTLLVTGQGFDEMQRMSDFAYDLAVQLITRFNEWSMHYSDGRILTLPYQREFANNRGRAAFFNNWRRILAAANGKLILVMYDEIDSFFDRPDQVNPIILSFLRSLMREAENGRFILVCSDKALSRDNQWFLDLIAGGQRIPVSHYSNEDVQLIFRALQDYYSERDSTIAKCIRLCDGHLRLIQIVSKVFIQRKLERINNEFLDDDDFEHISEESIDQAEVVLHILWNDLSREERSVVWGIGYIRNDLDVDSQFVVHDILTYLMHRFPQLDQEQLIEGVDRLSNRKWVEWADRNRTSFNFKPGIIRQWVRRRHVKLNQVGS
jgi:hypothetical protein